MKRVFFVMLYVVVCCITPITAHSQSSAAGVAMRFTEVPLSTFVSFYYKQLLRQNFVLSKEVVANSIPVTLDLKGVDPAKYDALFQSVFEQYGVLSERRDGVWYVTLGVPGQRPVREPSVSKASASGRLLDEPFPAFARETSAPVALPVEPPPLMGDALPLDKSDLRFYLPRARRPGELQLLVNKLLKTDFASSDRVFLRGSEKDVEKVLRVVEQFDSPPASVKVQALLLEFTDTSNRSRSFSLALSALGSKLGLSFGPTAALSNFVKIQSSSLNAVLSAVEGDSRFQLVDSPNTLCDHGETCRVQVGAEVPVLGAINLDKNGNPQNSITYRDSGSILDVTPEIMRDFIKLRVSQTVSSFTKNSTSGIDSPSILKRALNAVLTMQDGDMVVLGGLESSQSEATKSGLPFLPRFLDSTQNTKSSTQLLLVLHLERVKVSEGGS